MRIVVPRQPTARLSDAWRHCVGTGRLDLALRRDYQESLDLVQREIGFRHIRGHGLLSDGMGVHRPYDYAGERRVRHAFTYVDQVVDAYLSMGIAPFLELGFMPSGLASGDDTVFWWKGNVTPPRDEKEWADLVRAVIGHLVDRYGIDQVRRWPIEVWNEPNLAPFWPAGQDAYHRLYEVTSLAVKEVDAELQVGGPSLAPGYEDEWIQCFAEFVEARDLPIDFVSRHAYSSGPVQPVPFGAHQTLMPASALLEQFGAPRQQLAGTGLADLPLHITEFNSSYRPDNPVHDTAFHAAYLAPVLANGGDLADSFSYWTFSDVFEEVGIPTAPFHGGFGLLTHRQIRKPTYHLYTFMAEMGEQVLARGEDHLVTRHGDGRVTVLAWSPADPAGGDPVDGHTVRLSLPVGAPDAQGSAYARRRSVSEDAGNPWAAWCEMGRPLAPGNRQLDALREAAEPARSHRSVPVAGGRADVDLVLGRNEVTLLELTPVVDETPEWWSDDRLFGLGGEDADASVNRP
ncbi:GH39 family glycosyl hydrolase [Streptomyces poonensis]|uniref:Beta-xylosidase n=1 Tax=Streptomyces poonensis TaxID=68255 RepID=A0A918PFH3_9ACTN|nr:xylan 1,4-beta-xylosidase [Streptomyces poonensis]GGZ04392.1 beta-xylosidase [Streptomyces poonensis]GLJ89365.1 beta-xylosidase [Streptomyces poonensis]